MAIERVISRVANGGHSIPREVIIRRHRRGIENLTKIYLAIVDNWFVLDNSSLTPNLIAEGNKEVDIQIYNHELWDSINKRSDE